MGMSKRWMMEQEEMRFAARAILCEADVLKECEWHTDCFMDNSITGDLTQAYKIANHGISAGVIDYDRRGLTDAIKEQGELYWPNECERCNRL
jgi:hypothetical protein